MQLVRNLMLAAALVVAAAVPAVAQTAKTAKSAKADDVIKVAIHVNDDDAARMNLALNNVHNMIVDFKKAKKTYSIEVVAYGPGLNMFLEETSPVKARIQEISLANPEVTFAACSNTHTRMSKAKKKDIKIVSEAKLVPSGVIRLVELQRDGYAYIRP